MARAFLQASFQTPESSSDADLRVASGKALTFYESDGTTPITTTIYASATGSTVATLTTDSNGEFVGYSNVPKRVQIAVAGRTTKVVAAFLDDDAKRPISVTDFGAVGDGVTDDTAAIQAAITYAESLTYAKLAFPPGIYLHTGLVSTTRIIWEGCGQDRSILQLAGTVSTTTDNIRVVAGTSGNDLGGGEIRDLGITAASASAGRHAIHLDGSVTNSQFFRFRVAGCNINASTSVAAARAIATTTSSPSGSTWISELEITFSKVVGGIKLDDAADQVWITRNLIAGPNVGIEANCKLAGASKWVIRENTCVSAQSLWFKTYANNLTIEDNYFEAIAAWPVFAAGSGWSGTQAIVHLDATTAGDIKNTIIRNNQISLLTGHTGQCLYLSKTKNTIVEDNQFYPADGGTFGVTVGATCTGTRIGPFQQPDGSGTFVQNLGEIDLDYRLSYDRADEVSLAQNATVSLSATAAGTLHVFVPATGDAAVGTLHSTAQVVTSISATNLGGAGTGITLGADTGTGVSVYHDGSVYRIKNRNVTTRVVRYRLVGLN